MHTTTHHKTSIIQKFSNQIDSSDSPLNDWKIGIASWERISRLEIQEEMLYKVCDINLAKEILFHFIAQGVQTCKMSKSNYDGIYLYK